MPNTLDVLHLYSGNLFGGVERMLISLAALDAPPYRSHFALCFEGKLSHALRAVHAPVALLGAVRLRSPWSVLQARRALKGLLRRQSFEAIVCHSVWTYCIFAPVIARAGLGPILFLHDIPNPKGVLYRWAWLSPPTLCIANSATTAEPLSRMRSQVPTRVVYPLVKPPSAPDRGAMRQLREQWGARPEEVIVLLASRFEALKGHRNLLQALGALRDIPGWRCWIAGAPQRPEEEAYRRELESMVESLHLSDRVQFIGHRDDMEITLAACDIYCQPNEIGEAFGMVFVEALYAGKPVVGRALGGAREIVTAECGILCAPGSEALATALQSLLGDRALRARMADAGPARAAALCAPQSFRAQFAAALESVRG